MNVQMFVKGHQKIIFSFLPAYISFTFGSRFLWRKANIQIKQIIINNFFKNLD